MFWAQFCFLTFLLTCPAAPPHCSTEICHGHLHPMVTSCLPGFSSSVNCLHHLAAQAWVSPSFSSHSSPYQVPQSYIPNLPHVGPLFSIPSTLCLTHHPCPLRLFWSPPLWLPAHCLPPASPPPCRQNQFSKACLLKTFQWLPWAQGRVTFPDMSAEPHMLQPCMLFQPHLSPLPTSHFILHFWKQDATAPSLSCGLTLVLPYPRNTAYLPQTPWSAISGLSLEPHLECHSFPTRGLSCSLT